LRFHVNGAPREATSPLSLDGLLESCGLGGLRVAVAINAQVIPRSRYAETKIQAGDRIEIIHAVGGG